MSLGGWVKKHATGLSLFGFIVFCSTVFCLTIGIVWYYFHQDSQVITKAISTQLSTQKNDFSTLKVDYDKLKKSYTDLETDRDNVLDKTKSLLKQKQIWAELEEKHQVIRKANSTVRRQLNESRQSEEALTKKLDSALKQVDREKLANEKLQDQKDELDRENDVLQEETTKTVTQTAEYQSLSKESQTLKKEKATYESTLKKLQDSQARIVAKDKKLEAEAAKLRKENAAMNKNIRRLTGEKNKLGEMNKQNAQFNKALPTKVSGVSEENKRLVKELALTHYNMGVFFIEKKLYDRAVSEFERSLALDPSNAKAHYNVGLLYSGELNQQDKAIAHFRRYLDAYPNSKESNQVRSYLLVRDVYGDKSAKNIK